MATIEELMTRVVLTAEPQQSVGDARKLMKGAAIRHLAIVEGDALVGVLSSHDLPAEDGTPIADAMSASPVTIAVDARASEAVVKMLQHEISSLPVVTAVGALVGIVTSTDLLMVAYDALVASDGPAPGPPPRADVANVVLGAKLDRVRRAPDPGMAAMALKELGRYLQRTYDRRQAEGGTFHSALAAHPDLSADIAELCEHQARILARATALRETNVSLADKGAATVAAGSEDLIADIEKVEKRARTILEPSGASA